MKGGGGTPNAGGPCGLLPRRDRHERGSSEGVFLSFSPQQTFPREPGSMDTDDVAASPPAYNGDTPRSEHPRPDWVRLSAGSVQPGYTSLNGSWLFAFDDEDCGRRDKWYLDSAPNRNPIFSRNITVPFAFQTEASTLGERTYHEILWFVLQTKRPMQRGCDHLLHFGAVDYEADVWVNGQHVASHRGGQVPFSADITAQIEEEKISGAPLTIFVRAHDRIQDLTQPRGKQVSSAAASIQKRLAQATDVSDPSPAVLETQKRVHLLHALQRHPPIRMAGVCPQATHRARYSRPQHRQLHARH